MIAGAAPDDLPPLLAALDVPMIVVTTANDRGDRAGCLVGFHAQCSIDPLRYVVWLSKANHTAHVAMTARHLAVHFLSEDEHDLAELFGATTGDEVDKFARCDVEDGADGVPLLTRCRNRFVGRRHAVLDEGSDHVCFVLEPVEVRTERPFRPLRFHAVQDITPGHEAEEDRITPE